MDILIISLLIRLAFCTIGFILNGTLVYVTWKNRSLRNSCNLLIAFDSLTACMYLFGKLPELFFIIKNDLRIPISECFFYHIFAHFAHFFNKTAMLYIGFDRVLAVYCPIWYGKKNSRIYLFELLAVSVTVYSLLFTLIFMKCFFSDNSIVECEGITALYYNWENLFYLFVWVILFITNVFYALIWIKIKLLKRSEMSSFIYTERLLKSLLVLAIVYNFGNILPLAFGMAKPLLMNKNMAFYSYQMALFTTIFMFSANPLLLYIFSLDYKDAYRRTFFANNSIAVLNNNNANSKSFVLPRSINNKQII